MQDQLQLTSIEPLTRTARGIGLGPASINDLKPGDYVHDWHYGRNRNGIGGTGDAGPAAKLDEARRYQKTYFGNVNSYLQFNISGRLECKNGSGCRY